MKDYEILLQKLEREIREHISIEHQLKIQCEKYAEKLDILEKDKIILLSQIDDERKEFNEQLEELTKQIDNYLKHKNNFQQNEKKYKIELENKEKEINQLKEKIDLLNKNIKDLENKIKINKNIIEEQKKQQLNSTIHNNQEEISDYKKINCSLSKLNLKAFNKRNINNFHNTNNSNITNNSKSIFQNLQNQKRINTKKLLLRNMSGTNIDLYNIDNLKKKNIISNFSINDSIGNYLYKKNDESEFHNASRDNSYNFKITNNNRSQINNNNKLKLKLPMNITNNNYNMNKNNVMINLSTNIVSDNLNLEKLKVQQKLVEYRKLIDKKINELVNNKKRKTNQNKKRANSMFDNTIYKKINISSINSEYEHKPKKKINNISNTNHKYINKEFFKNIRDKNLIKPKKIYDYDNKKKIKINSQRNIRSREHNKNKLNIISKNKDAKGKYDLNNFEDEKIDNKIHEQITSKGNFEEKSEDSKQ